MAGFSVLSREEDLKNLQLSAWECIRDWFDPVCVRIDSSIIEEVESIQVVRGSSVELSREGIATEDQREWEEEEFCIDKKERSRIESAT